MLENQRRASSSMRPHEHLKTHGFQTDVGGSYVTIRALKTTFKFEIENRLVVVFKLSMLLYIQRWPETTFRKGFRKRILFKYCFYVNFVLQSRNH